jgi:nucleoside-diphosphate-sugar epimerase
MKALIAGGSGYFGSRLVEKLLFKDWDCKIFDLNAYDGNKSVQFLKGDIRDYEDVISACEGVDVVFHNVAQVPLAKDRDLFDSVNNLGTENILKACSNSGVKKIIYTSSSAVYGIPSINPVNEAMSPRPQESYGEAKYNGEKICNEYISDNLDVIIIRPRTILGHGRLGIFQILFEWIREGKNIPVLGSGNNIYQFIHADDLADAIILCSNDKVKSGIYNCGSEHYSTMRNTLENLCEYAGTGSIVKNVPFKPAVIGMQISSFFGLSPLGSYHSLMYGRSMYFDISKAKNELGWQPKYSSDEMFKQSYDWYCQNRDSIINNKNVRSHHQSKVKQGILSLFNKFL